MIQYPNIVKKDPWLEPHRKILARLHNLYLTKLIDLSPDMYLSDYANGFNYYGLFSFNDNYILRERLIGVDEAWFLCDYNGWTCQENFKLKINGDDASISIPKYYLPNGFEYKLRIRIGLELRDIIPPHSRFNRQIKGSTAFNAINYDPFEPYKFKFDRPETPNIPLIYETHIGMSGETPEINTFKEFTDRMIPYIKECGYNTIQLMAIMDHPYYGSFGYHVAGFYAVSSFFGTPNDLKLLIDTAHENGLSVIMDLVHSHAVKNYNESPAGIENDKFSYFTKEIHQAWDSRLFDYRDERVLHFLLSNLKFWLTEYNFDGFRFDGVTSMLYKSHGLGKNFTCYNDYFNSDLNYDAVIYLKLAMKLISELGDYITIAEDMSGFPGMADRITEGGIGFKYRLAMGVPDMWIKLLDKTKDEDWNTDFIYNELSTSRIDEKKINYAESHDQALVGDKTIIFRLLDKLMYDSMHENITDPIVSRGIALHKMIRLITLFTTNGGYLNFMGNEFGHPEWIDFPRDGNNWSYDKCRRLWSILHDNSLVYKYLAVFDKKMLEVFQELNCLSKLRVIKLDNVKKIIAFGCQSLIAVFNFHTDHAAVGLEVPCERDVEIVLSTDSKKYYGFGNIDEGVNIYRINKLLHLDMPPRTAIICKKIE
ncbi:MAG: alpha amylase C-terminal domain-containing protein [Candidatus Delongbacteria bacterium]|nr:alpha amylase C-terminal domain-containing protein [Candidatus Delongbacteria bacterium]MBN2835047.1 alpha amylase C-terminal domain-containing protein [Candidatus Delongbacteria bacterium]